MAEEARMLLRNHKECCARAKVLEEKIRQTEQHYGIPSDDYLIETIVYTRPHLDGLPHTPRYGSKTESIALNMDNERLNARREIEDTLQEWKASLNRLKHQIRLYTAVFNMLTDEERALVIQHYQNRRSLEQISNEPLVHYSTHVKSVSTLRRMLSGILKKAQVVIESK